MSPPPPSSTLAVDYRHWVSDHKCIYGIETTDAVMGLKSNWMVLTDLIMGQAGHPLVYDHPHDHLWTPNDHPLTPPRDPL